ncbi:MAG: circadian clock KaiB family protein [Cyanobacteria bacterium P01_A01_bin.17]
MAFHESHPSASLYKGLALVTPGGDLVYAIDPSKQQHWHAQLCAVLQQRLNLPEAPLFLTPSHTATVDRWIDPQSQEVRVVAEAYPPVWRYRIFFQAIFDVPVHQWRPIPARDPAQDGRVVHSYREQFPQLWESHNWVIRADDPPPSEPETLAPELAEAREPVYVLHLFIARHSRKTTQTLKVLHQVLEQALACPYTLKIIDVTQHPEQAEAAQVLATPTLVRVWPQPIQKLVGDLNQARILQMLTV